MTITTFSKLLNAKRAVKDRGLKPGEYEITMHGKRASVTILKTGPAAPAPKAAKVPAPKPTRPARGPSPAALGTAAAKADNAAKATPARQPHDDKPVITDASILPNPPDFTANTHKPYRKKLDALTALVAARDIAGLEAFTINPTSTSPKALVKYRDRAIAALRFQSNEAAR